MVVEIGIGAHWGTASRRDARSGPGLPLPSIDADFDRRGMSVDSFQPRQQFRLIPRDDDEDVLRGHVAGPREVSGRAAMR